MIMPPARYSPSPPCIIYPSLLKGLLDTRFCMNPPSAFSLDVSFDLNSSDFLLASLDLDSDNRDCLLRAASHLPSPSVSVNIGRNRLYHIVTPYPKILHILIEIFLNPWVYLSPLLCLYQKHTYDWPWPSWSNNLPHLSLRQDWIPRPQKTLRLSWPSPPCPGSSTDPYTYWNFPFWDLQRRWTCCCILSPSPLSQSPWPRNSHLKTILSCPWHRPFPFWPP